MSTGYGLFNKCTPCCDEWPFWSVNATIRDFMWGPLTGPAPYTPYLAKTLTISMNLMGTAYNYTGTITLDPLREAVSTSESTSWNSSLESILEDFIYGKTGLGGSPSLQSAISTYNGSGYGTPPSGFTMSPTSITKTYSFYNGPGSSYPATHWDGTVTLSLSSAYSTGPSDLDTLLATRPSYATMETTFLSQSPAHQGFIVAYNKATVNASNGATYPGGNYDSGNHTNYPSTYVAFCSAYWPTWRDGSGLIYKPFGTAPSLVSTTFIDTGDIGQQDYQPVSNFMESYLLMGGGRYTFQKGLLYVRIAEPICLVESSVPISIAADGTETDGSTTTTYTLATYSAGSVVAFSGSVPSAGSSSWTNYNKYMKAGATSYAIWKATAPRTYYSPVYLTCP